MFSVKAFSTNFQDSLGLLPRRHDFRNNDSESILTKGEKCFHRRHLLCLPSFHDQTFNFCWFNMGIRQWKVSLNVQRHWPIYDQELTWNILSQFFIKRFLPQGYLTSQNITYSIPARLGGVISLLGGLKANISTDDPTAITVVESVSDFMLL